jgi:hypothetical protein
MVYYVEQRKHGFAVTGQLNKAQANMGEKEANKKAHRLAGHDGIVGCKAINRQFEGWCMCAVCRHNRG